MLVLRTLTSTDEATFYQAVQTWPQSERSWITFDWKPGIVFMDHIAKLERDRLGIGLEQGRVPHSMLYAFVDGRIVGRVSVRHQLNDRLLKRGGHIGYSVNPNERQKGYALEMLTQALKYCQGLGLSKVLITTDDNNIPSYKIIEKCHGVLENKVWDDEDRVFVRRYWVPTLS